MDVIGVDPVELLDFNADLLDAARRRDDREPHRRVGRKVRKDLFFDFGLRAPDFEQPDGHSEVHTRRRGDHTADFRGRPKADFNHGRVDPIGACESVDVPIEDVCDRSHVQPGMRNLDPLPGDGDPFAHQGVTGEPLFRETGVDVQGVGETDEMDVERGGQAS